MGLGVLPLDSLMAGGLAIGVILGAAIQTSRFCLVAAVANAALVRDFRQAIGWLVALAVALAGTQWLEWRALVEVADSGYRAGRLDWAGAAIGGLLFGVGSMLAGGCAARTLVGASEGNLGGWIALVAFALCAWLALFGALEPARIALVTRTAVELRAGDASLAKLAGAPPALVAASAVVVVLALAVVLWRRGNDASLAFAGLVIGALVIAGWWVTGVLGPASMAAVRPDSISFSGPLARAARALATGSLSGGVFGVALLAGTMIGAFVTALARGRFRVARPTREQAVHSLVGGVLMGLGGGLAGGCNIGHGLTGLATLSLKSLVVVAGIVAGMLIALAWLYRQSPASSNATTSAAEGRGRLASR
jgi:uncharacterized membrane protein YedE/YeeE